METLPSHTELLATNRLTEVQAVEIRCGNGIFWGVQYHPEIGLDEVAAALRRQCDDLISAGLARSWDDVEGYACQIDALHGDPSRRDIAWRLGLDEEVSDPNRRRTELRNFVERLALPHRSARAMT